MAIALIVEEYGQHIDAASEYANIQTTKKLEAEKARIMADSRYATNLRKERHLIRNKLKKEQADHATAVDNSHRRWIENLACNLSRQQQLDGVENTNCRRKLTAWR